jgi:hypothetical protein
MMLVVGGVGGLIQLALTVGLAWWGANVGRRRGGAWRHLVWLPLAGLLAGGLGIGVTVLGLIRAFDAVESVDAARKADVLADGIAQAMTATAVFVPISWGLYALALFGCIFGWALPVRAAEPPR